MRIILLTLLTVLYFAPAYAYIEDSRVGESQMTAGEQYSHLNKLNDKRIMAIKKLKKADEYVSRAEAYGKKVSAQDFESLLSSVQEDRKQQELRRINILAEQKIKNPRLLITQTDHSVYDNLYKLQAMQSKDRNIAGALRQQLKREMK